MKPPRTIAVGDRLTLPCCGCAGQAMFTTAGSHPTFFHTIPYCARFESVNTVAELSAYMKECGAKGQYLKAN